MNVPCDFVNNGKTELKAVINYFYLKKLTLLESVSSFSMVKDCIDEFKRGLINNESRSGRLKTATSPDMIKNSHRIVLDDRREEVRTIANNLNINVHRIVTDELLEIKKNTLRLRLLTPEQKLNGLSVSCDLLVHFRHNPKYFLRHFMIVDENWVHDYTPKIKE